MAVVVALDAGTTGVRAMAVGEDAKPVASRYLELPQHFPRPGWVEHDPEEIWNAAGGTLSGLLEDLDQPVAAIGITNQRETAVVWDRRSGQPLHNAIVWQDRRTADDCDALAAGGHLGLIRGRTGLVLDPYFSATKLRWLFREGGVEPGPQLGFGTVDSWLIWRLSHGAAHVTEPSNASRTMLFDIDALRWDPELAELFSVPLACLPEVRPSSGRIALSANGAVAGLPGGVPISGAAGDQQAALFGQACFRPGMTKNTYGTGSFVLMNVGTAHPPPVEGLLTTVGWSLANPERVDYALEGAIFVTGAAIQWMRDQLGLIGSAAEIGPLAESAGDAAGAYLVPALTGLGSPWWDPRARGAILGLTRGVGRAHLARAVLEAMAYQTRDVVDRMVASSGQPLTEMRVDGGASVVDLLLRLQSELLGARVLRAAVTETTALGAAFLAGLAEGVWSGLDEISSLWSADASFEPSGTDPAPSAGHDGWLRAVDRSRDWERVRG